VGVARIELATSALSVLRSNRLSYTPGWTFVFLNLPSPTLGPSSTTLARMPYGAGSMRETSKGIWRLRVYVGDDPVNGSPVQRQRTFRGTETQARKALVSFQSEVQREPKFDKGQATVGELLDRWLEHIEALGKARPKTLYEYRNKIEKKPGKHGEPGGIRAVLGQTPLRKLQADRLDQCYQRWLDAGLSPSTVHIYHSILSAACRQAVKWGWIDSAPTARATPPAPRVTRMRIPTTEQLRTLVSAAQKYDSVLGTAVALAALTGARRGELVALRWSDVDLEHGNVRIARSVTVVAGESIDGPTKTHQVRDIALDELCVRVLRARWAEMSSLSDEAASPLIEDPYILSYNANGARPVGPDTLTHRFTAVCRSLERSSVGKEWPFRFHDLRHFSVSTLIAAGVDIRTVSERHGHAQATMTLNRYAHALPERDRQAARVLGRAFSN
jgi:integrase